MSKAIDVTKLDDAVRMGLLAMLEAGEREDEFIRLRQLRQFKKNNLFWHGFQYLFWSDIDQDWRIPTHEQYEDESTREETQFIYNYVINHFKAHGESIIAALSADIPDVRFGPVDADDPDDRRAVDAADNCVQLIEKWNRAKLQIINALFYLATEGFCASYTYNKKDPTFGTVNVKSYTSEPMQTSPDMHVCPSCQYSEQAPSSQSPGPSVSLGGGDGQSEEAAEPAEGADQDQGDEPESPEEEAGETPQDEAEEDAAQPTTGPENVQGMNTPCPQCGDDMQMQPGMVEDVPLLSGERPVPKGREVIEVYGALNVRVPSYVAKQADAPFLIHYVDAHPALFKEAFPKVADEIESDPGQDYERLMRQSSLAMDGSNLNIKLATQKRVWFRPWYTNVLGKDQENVVKQIRKLCKKGIYISAVGTTLCELRDESMDEHWTLAKAGPSKGIHADPLLQSYVPVQELRNNLTNLFTMQVEFGVPSTYADAEVFDFAGQSKMESSPGFVYPVDPKPGQSIADSFYTERTASLSKDATEFMAHLDQDGQFVIGDFPSIYGGPSQSGSKTLGEYDRSRSFALQRLSLVWFFINVWWGETIHKALLSFILHQIEDESITVQNKPGEFQTKWIKAADLKGSFDRLDPDVASDFPSTFSQKRGLIMQLLGLNNPEINQVIFSPDNIHTVQAYMGMTELRLPQEIQRNKQMREIGALTGMEPTGTSTGDVLSSVPIEPDIDDDDIHILTCVEFLCSNTGQDLKESNMGAYANVLAHLVEHKQHKMQMMMPPPGMAPGPQGPPGPHAGSPPGAPPSKPGMHPGGVGMPPPPQGPSNSGAPSPGA